MISQAGECVDVTGIIFLSVDCKNPLDVVFLLDGSGKGSDMEKYRWDKMVEFVSGMMESFYENQARTGVITYGSQPKVIYDLHNVDKELLARDLSSQLRYPGGSQTINSALKLAWNTQFKKSNQPSNKVIVALTTGNIPYGLWGSSSFLKKRNIRVIGVGVDRRPTYKYLESLATGSYPRNIFSLDTTQLKDAVPYVVGDICKGKVSLMCQDLTIRKFYR